MRALPVALLLVALLAGGCGGSKPKADPDDAVRGRRLTIYSSQPLSGYQARRARDVVAAERLALTEAGGRVGRWAITYRALDSADPRTGLWSPALVAANAHRATEDPTTIAYLGELDSGASAVAIPILNDKGILTVSPLDGVAGLTARAGAGPGEPAKYYPTRRRTFARLVASDDVQAAALVAYMQDERVRRLYLTHDDSLYGSSLALIVQRRARAAGIAVLADKGIDPRTLRPGRLAGEVARLRADGFLHAGQLEPGVGLLYQAVHSADRAARLFAPSALADPAFLSVLGSARARTRLVAAALPPRIRGPQGEAFERRFRTAYGRLPDPAAAAGYEAMSALLAALERAGPRAGSRSAVVRAFMGLRNRQSALGRYDMSPNGDPTFRTFGAYRARGGRLVFERVLDPLGA